jgi:hypothetical protein
MFFHAWWQRRRERRSLVRRACQFAESAFASAHPGETVEGARVRAVESDRVVVAVFLKPPHLYRGTPPHRIVAVLNDFSGWEELPEDRNSAYVLRGIK